MSTRHRGRLEIPTWSEKAFDEDASFRWGDAADRPDNVSAKKGLKFYSGFELNGVLYNREDCVLIDNADALDASDGSQLYVARLEALCDLGEESKLGYRYQGWVSWYTRPSEAKKHKISLPHDIDDKREVLRSNPKTGGKQIDLETIRSKCKVIHVPETVTTLEFADVVDDDDNPQLYCRYEIINRQHLKAVITPATTPRKVSKTSSKVSTINVFKNKKVSAEEMGILDSLALEHKNVIKHEALVSMSPRKMVSPIKLVRNKNKENQYTPEKRIAIDTRRPDTVEKLSWKVSDLTVRTPQRSAFTEIMPNNKDIPQTPKSTNVNTVDTTTTTRSGRKVRRAMTFDEEEFPAARRSSIDKLNTLRDEDLLSEESYVGSSTEESTDESEGTDSDDDVIIKPKSKRSQGFTKGLMHTPSTKNVRGQLTRKANLKCSTNSKVISQKAPGMPLRRVFHRNNTNNDFEMALDKLHVCAVPDQLSCRETQFAEIFDFVESRLSDEAGGCMYISGVPGTGKTATVREVMTALNEAQKNYEVPKFKYIEINGMKLTEPHQAYVQILRQLTGKKTTPEHAAEVLTNMFKAKKSNAKSAMIVLLADELDLLWTRKQQVLYNLFDWPTHPNSRLVVVAIANTMDLPERMVMNKVASRMGLSRMTFQPYTFQELQEIVRARLDGLDLVDPDAVQLVSRKVAALSGDARRALDVCRRAVELSGKDDQRGAVQQTSTSPIKKAKKYPVTMRHVSQAIQEMFASAKMVAISSLSVNEQLLLRAIIEEFKRTGVEETVFHKVQSQYETLARLDGVAPVHCTLLSTMLARMASFRLLTLSDSRHDFQQKIYMNVTQDDVHFALKQLQKKESNFNND
ncbi:origin recognition complex subunit 1-like [Varroa destructor]|uniref:Origin recognition complex subunit 1 n=1 Tax=Varroa destructor TaxID=109461 RepID=A0A7M7KPS1_VARDE|nr:origin recognition complex subunit 1-like [Varroa destructor]